MKPTKDANAHFSFLIGEFANRLESTTTIEVESNE